MLNARANLWLRLNSLVEYDLICNEKKKYKRILNLNFFLMMEFSALKRFNGKCEIFATAPVAPW